MENEFLEQHRKAWQAFNKWHKETPPAVRQVFLEGYAIDDAEERNRVAPGRYPIPPRERRERCRPEERVVLLLLTYVQLDASWTIRPEFVIVRIQNVLGGWYHGWILEGLRYATRIEIGRRIDFEPRHIVSVFDLHPTN